MAGQLWCAVDSALKIIGDRWTLAIVHELSLGPRRTVELHHGFNGLSTKTLLARLRKLERAGLVSRQTFSESPPRVEYSLTAKGHILLPVVREMGKSALLWDNPGRHDLECKACSALDTVSEATTEQETSIVETADTRARPSIEPLPVRRQIRKRRDIILL
jgi:DNA-binding HxlR family transcriptional regulator